MTNPSLFNVLLIWPITNILVAIYQGLTILHIPYALGFSIILLTIVIRVVLYPLTNSQLKASKKMQAVAPQVNRLREKHKNDAKMLQSETMRLYKEHGINPLAGCLPVIIQLPIIWSLYAVLRSVVSTTSQVSFLTAINKIIYFPSFRLHRSWDQHFFGIPLGQAPSHLLSTIGYTILLFPIVTALLQFLQSKMMFAPVAQAPKASDKKTSTQDDFAQAMQTQSTYVFPLMIGFFSFNFPVGLSLYWNTFTIFAMIQQYKIAGLGGLKPLIDKLLKKETV